MTLKLQDHLGHGGNGQADANAANQNHRKLEQWLNDQLVDVRLYGPGVGVGGDDSQAIESAISEAIRLNSPGILLGASHTLSSAIDLSGLAGTNRGFAVMGRGSGNLTGATGFSGRTQLKNASGGTAIKAFGSLSGGTGLTIVGLRLQDFAIQNQSNIGAGTYTVDLDYCTDQLFLDNIFIDGNSVTGNGVQWRNMGHGQSVWNGVQARNLTTPFRIAVETTANVDTAPNSGNSVFNGCSAMDCTTGWHIHGSGNLIDGLTFNAPKATNSADVTGSTGFHIQGAVEACTFNGLHAERFSTGVALNSSPRLNVFNSPLCSYPAGTPDANSAGFRFGAGSPRGNAVWGLRATGTHYGASFENTSGNNIVFGGPSTGSVLTAFYNDSSTDATNQMHEAYQTNPVLNFQRNILQLSERNSLPAAPATNEVKLYAKDNGAGKTQFVARFATGAEQVIATEP